MIVGFKFQNYRSYRDEADFTMKAQDSEFNSRSITKVELKDGTSIRLVNTAAIFGANASGKSNVVHALADLSYTVKNSLTFNQNHPIPFRIYYGLDGECEKRSTKISIDFITNGIRFIYEVEADNQFIIREELSKYIDNSLQLIYKRADNSDGRNIEIGEGYSSHSLDLSQVSLLKNQLLLSWLATKEANGIQNVADYLAGLNIQTSDQMTLGGSRFGKIAEKYFDGGKSPLCRRFSRLLQIADLGITETVLKRHDDSDFTIPTTIPEDIKTKFIEENRWEFFLIHRMDNPDKGCLLPFNLESEGTKALFCLAPTLLYALENGSFVAYDEISSAIHPALLRLLVNLFQNPKSNPKGAQLIFTTHDASVADYNTLRADQIWFAEKKNGSSELFSAQDFEDVSINVPFERWYRAGRFGALPNFSSIDYIFE